jgi:membrane associated rhomboid family serine protease
MFSNLLPAKDRKISFEGHVFGFVSGIAAAYLI